MKREKRFWDMKPEEIASFVDRYGMDDWLHKVRRDREHVHEVRKGPNPWAAGTENEKRQEIIVHLDPAWAEELQQEAREGRRHRNPLQTRP